MSLQSLLGVELPIIQAPMAGVQGSALAVAVSNAGGLGSLLEISQGGKQPVQLANGEARSFLDDGDEICLSAWCEAEGAVRIGIGECVGRVVPAA